MMSPSKQKSVDVQLQPRRAQWKPYSCTRFLCAYENPPQIAYGTFRCGAPKCTGTFEVSPKEAYSYHQACLEKIAAENQVREQEKYRKWDLADDLINNKTTLRRYTEEMELYERVFDDEKNFNYSSASYKIQLAAGQTFEEAQASLQRQLRAMKIRHEELNEEKQRLERIVMRDLHTLVGMSSDTGVSAAGSPKMPDQGGHTKYK
ncbi:hypothetical protein BDY19DRAFT_991736 [Irpex rosettiformis]|uniref:Uncharacterized protein n=1 Tax=Irpex rosettiformis TaxID=378272 RepID=A0ACB8U9U1_9APHY|nr:hypothetical protein BDY19DRAFT_991736 [Irpex rosettiformis]